MNNIPSVVILFSAESFDRDESQRVDGGNEITPAAAAATTERKNERQLPTEEEGDVNVKQEPVSQNMDSKQPNPSSVQNNPDQLNAEETSQNSKSTALNGQLAEPEIKHQSPVESPESGTKRLIYADRRRQSETGRREMSSKTEFFDDISLESEESIKSSKELNSSERIADELNQRNRIAQVAPVAKELSRPTPVPRQSLRSKKSVAQNLVTEMNLGSTGVFCVELLPLSQLDSYHRKLNSGGPLRNRASISDDDDETSFERLPDRNIIRMNSRSPPTQRGNFFSKKSVSSSDSLAVSPKTDSGIAHLENVFVFDERFNSPSPHTGTGNSAGGISRDRSTRNTITTATERAEVFRTSKERTQPKMPSWSKAPLGQALSLDRRQTYHSTAAHLRSQNTDDASTQTVFYPSRDGQGTIDEDSSFTVMPTPPSRSVDKRQGKALVQLSRSHQLQQQPSATSDIDEMHGRRKAGRNDSIIHRIILNDSEQATCKITSFT